MGVMLLFVQRTHMHVYAYNYIYTSSTLTIHIYTIPCSMWTGWTRTTCPQSGHRPQPVTGTRIHLAKTGLRVSKVILYV